MKLSISVMTNDMTVLEWTCIYIENMALWAVKVVWEVLTYFLISKVSGLVTSLHSSCFSPGSVETLRTGLWSEQPWPEVWHARLSIWEQTCNLGWFTMLQLTAKHTRWCFGIYSLDYDDFQGCDILRVIISVCWWELSHCQCHWSQDYVCREREEYGC